MTQDSGNSKQAVVIGTSPIMLCAAITLAENGWHRSVRSRNETDRAARGGPSVRSDAIASNPPCTCLRTDAEHTSDSPKIWGCHSPRKPDHMASFAESDWVFMSLGWCVSPGSVSKARFAATATRRPWDSEVPDAH